MNRFPSTFCKVIYLEDSHEQRIYKGTKVSQSQDCSVLISAKAKLGYEPQ